MLSRRITMLHLPIGYDDFGKIIEKKLYFVDKTLFIKEFIDDDAEVILITRPRRFGKTLMMSVLQHFFAKTVHRKETAGLFDRFHIAKEADCMALQGQYPVISLSFKDIKDRHYILPTQNL